MAGINGAIEIKRRGGNDQGGIVAHQRHAPSARQSIGGIKRGGRVA